MSGGLVGWAQKASDAKVLMKGLAAVVENQAPVVRFLVRNWPVTAIIAVALYGQLRKRHRNKELNLYTVTTDTGLLLAPMVALFSLQKLATEEELRKQQAAAPDLPMAMTALTPSPSVQGWY